MIGCIEETYEVDKTAAALCASQCLLKSFLDSASEAKHSIGYEFKSLLPVRTFGAKAVKSIPIERA